MGRTEFLTPTIRSEPRLESANHPPKRKMALFNECTQSCAHIVLDMADIVRDGDLSTTIRGSCVSPLPEGSILVQFYCCFPITRIWNEFGIIGGRGPRIQAGAPEGGPAAGGVPGV